MLKKILITGGCGFVGSNICLSLNKLAFKVYSLDSLVRKGSLYNFQLLKKAGIKNFKLDIFDYKKISKLPKFDLVIDCCAEAAVEVSKNELVNICRLAENEWVGLPCGILDQGTSTFGQSDQIVRIDCASEIFSTLPLPSSTSFWIFDTGIKHDLVDSLYGTRNQECMDALSLLKKNDSSLECLANCSVALLEQTEMPENLKNRARHVVEEQKRVNQFIEGLKSGKEVNELGALLNASHTSSSNLFENSLPQLDYLVDLLSNTEEVHGARLTGGGFGGAVLAWTTNKFSEKHATSIAQTYEKNWQYFPGFHSFLPSNGACYYNPLDKRFIP